MHRYQTVIFDLDGTLLNTLDDLADSTNYALSCSGYPVRSNEEVRSFVGNGIAKLIERAVPKGTPQQEMTACLACFQAHYVDNMSNKTAPYPGVLQLLDKLPVSGLDCAVVSNKFDRAVKALCTSYFGARIPVAVGARQDMAKKPAPDTVFHALKELRASPEQAVYVGDSEVDILTARNAGLPCISVSWGFRDRKLLLAHGAATLVDTPDELCAALGLS